MTFKVPAYTEISHFRAPYKNSLMGLGAATYSGSTAKVTERSASSSGSGSGAYAGAAAASAGSKGASSYSSTAKPVLSAELAKAEALELYTRLVDDANVFLLGERRELWASRRAEKKITRAVEFGAQIKLILDKNSNWRSYYTSRIGAAVSKYESASVAQVPVELLKVISSESLVYTATGSANMFAPSFGTKPVSSEVKATGIGKTKLDAIASLEVQLKAKGVGGSLLTNAVKTATVVQSTLLSDETYSSIKVIFESIYKFFAASSVRKAARERSEKAAATARSAKQSSVALSKAAKAGDAGAEAQKATAEAAADKAKKEADEAAAAAKRAEEEKKAAEKAADEASKETGDKLVAEAEEKKDGDGAEVVAAKTAGMAGKVGIIAALALGGIILFAVASDKKKQAGAV